VEIIAEIIAQVFLWILQFLGELLIQIIAEVVFELIGHRIKEPLHRSRPVNSWLAATGYFIFGAMAGGISLWLLPELFISAPWLRVANLILTPIASGLFMGLLGAWRTSKQQELIRLDKFAYGYCFAIAMALVRFIFGQ